MKRLLAVPLVLMFTAPAHATTGMFCSTRGADPIALSLVISRVVARPLVSAKLTDRGAAVAATMAQWWLDQREMRLILIDPNAERKELVVTAKRRGDNYVGTLTRAGRSKAVRCEETG